MKQNSKEWLLPPTDQWLTIWGGFVLLLILAVTNFILSLFTNLTGTPWIYCYFSGLAIAITGASLIFYAKLPLYRQRRFFTFGPRALPIQRRPFYRWGYRCAIIGIIMLACLLLSM